MSRTRQVQLKRERRDIRDAKYILEEFRPQGRFKFYWQAINYLVRLARRKG